MPKAAAPFLFISAYYRNERRQQRRFRSLDNLLKWARLNKFLYGTPSADTPAVFAVVHVDGSPLTMGETLTIFRALNIPAYHKYQKRTIGNVSFPFEGLSQSVVKQRPIPPAQAHK